MKGSQRQVRLATLGGVFVTSFPSVILVAALPDIASRFDVAETSVGWVITAPTLASSVCVPLFGKLGDLRGHRRVFMVGFTLSIVFAALAAASWDLVPLIGFRTATMVAGAATGPTALALLMATHEPGERPKALGQWAFAGAAAPVIGLLAGGPLVDAISWRGLFVMQVGVALLVLPLCLRSLPETARLPDVRFDVLGGITLMVGSGAAVFALDRSGPWGFTATGVLVAAAVAPLALWAFVRVERRAHEPLFPLWLARRKDYVTAVAGEALLQVPSIGAFFIAPLVLTTVFDRSVGETAYLLIPMPLGMSLLAPVGGRLTLRYGERWTSVFGSALMTLGMITTGAGMVTETLALVIAGFAFHGGAIGLTRPSFGSSAAAALDETTTGVGMAVMRMTAQLGSATGISLAVAARGASGFGAAYVVLGIVAAIGTIVSLGVRDVVVHDEGDVAMGGALPALEA